MKPLNECHVLVTPPLYGRYDSTLKTELEALVNHVTYNHTGRPLNSTELQDLLPGVDGLIAGLDAVDGAALARADKLRVVARYGVGYSNIDLAAAQKRSIFVTNTPAANAKSVAELTLNLILNLIRPVITASMDTRAGGWMRTDGTLLHGKTVGLIGLGAIGREVARRLQGFDCRILAFDITYDEAFVEQYSIQKASVDDLLPQSDFVSLHVPVLDATRGMVNAAFLAQMKPGSYLVNTARGELVDEDALVKALKSGHLKGAAIDAFHHEPPGKDHPLPGLPQVIPTPHMGAHTDAAANTMGRMAMMNCLAALKGQEPPNRVV